MKRYFLFMMTAVLLISLSACEADNMEAPYCHITGKMCYQGMNIGVKGSGSNQLTPSIEIELWQSGFGKEAALNVNVTQDGTFSTYVYPGEIRLITKRGVGPWQQADTIRTTVKGDVNIDYEVIPYAMISDVNYTFDKENSLLTASFRIDKIVEDATVKSYGVLVNNTQFVDMSCNKASMTGSGQTGEVTLTLDCSSLKDCKALYARVFVKTDKSNYEIFSTTPYHVW